MLTLLQNNQAQQLKSNVTIPQVKSPLIGALVLLIGLPLLKFGTAAYFGSLHHWSDISLADISDATFHSFGAAVFWIFFKSPWASKITEITGISSATAADGTNVTQTQTLKIEQPSQVNIDPVAKI